MKEYYLDYESTMTFEEVSAAIAKHGYVLHRNVGQFRFTNSHYVFFKRGQSHEFMAATRFLDKVESKVMELIKKDE